MYITDQTNVDRKIHQFMAHKSVWKTLSQTIARQFTSDQRTPKTDEPTISYETLEWHHTSMRIRSGLQKAL